jgi:GAF domain-containing protein
VFQERRAGGLVTVMQEKRGLTLNGPSDARVLKLIRDELPAVVELWATEVGKVPFARVTEFVGAPQVRAERLRSYIIALLDYVENPDSRKAREILRSTIRSEHLRTLTLSKVVANQLILRRILVDLVQEKMPDASALGARRVASFAVDTGIEEIALLMEEHVQMQSVLVKCLSCAPGDRPELEQSFARFCRNAMDYFDADFVAVFRYLKDTDELMCIGCSAKGVAIPRDSRMFMSSFPLAVEAIQQKGPRTCISPAWSAGQKRKVLGQMTFDHCIVVPLMRGDTPLGILFVGDTAGPTTFTPDEVSIAEDFGSNIVRIMENVDLFEKLSLRARAQTALIETAANLQKEIESSQIYRIISEKMSELIPCNELAFYVYDWTRRVGNPVFATGPYASEVMEDRDFPAEVGFAGHVARTKKAEIVIDTEEDNRGAYIPGTPATHSRMLAVPILGKKDVLGVIELLKYPPDMFSTEDLEVATMFANHAAVALENAKLLGEVSSTRDQVQLHMDLLTHDIANYTTPVMAYVESLMGREGLAPEVAQAIERTYLQVDNIMFLVDMVRTLAKVSENASPKLVRTDLRTVLDGAVAEAKAKSPGRSLKVSIKLPQGPIMVSADPMLKDAFMNLFTVASRTAKGHETELSVSAEERTEGRRGMWWVKVADPGRAIPDALKSEVLMMTKRSRAELAGGFGIGLAAAKNIVERCSGKMWVSDIVANDPSKGCVFNLLVPKAE